MVAQSGRVIGRRVPRLYLIKLDDIRMASARRLFCSLQPSLRRLLCTPA